MIAAGELTASAPVAEHLASCAGCARRRPASGCLAAQPGGAGAPANFSSRVMTRMRAGALARRATARLGIQHRAGDGGDIGRARDVGGVRQSGFVVVSSDATRCSSQETLLAHRISPSLPRTVPPRRSWEPRWPSGGGPSETQPFARSNDSRARPRRWCHASAERVDRPDRAYTVSGSRDIRGAYPQLLSDRHWWHRDACPRPSPLGGHAVDDDDVRIEIQ